MSNKFHHYFPNNLVYEIMRPLYLRNKTKEVGQKKYRKHIGKSGVLKTEENIFSKIDDRIKEFKH